MLIRIDANDSGPLYEQIAGQLRALVADGEVGPGDRLPTARELAESLDVNMHTVLRAYGLLRDEGLVEMRRRRGVTVRAGGDGRARLTELVRRLRAEARQQGVGVEELHRLVEEAG